jgi:hypothetical protein
MHITHLFVFVSQLHISEVLKGSDTTIYKVLNISEPSTHFNWIEYLKPSLDLLIALVGAFVLVWKYLTQKQKEFEERTVENKQQAYAEFLKNFTETAVRIMHDKEIGSIKEDRERLFARNQLLLYANDKVIRSYHNWVEFADQDDHDINEEVKLFGLLLLEIRKDIHGNSKATEEEISNLNPFNRG